ncbi:MAG: 5'-methylthioadenosine/S-adenosylhomocysteine nucleosidase [Clostridia bacterium]|nr:5'-methylthioadenosine/S-adenosylhomocysteine nucleosidase [Clostridia bacterium]
MNKDIKIGLIFADDTEYVPFVKRMDKYEIKNEKKRGNDGCVITVRKADRAIEIHAVQSGIGKVRAAAAAAFLIADDKVDFIMNLGFSGAVSGLRRGMLACGTSYCEVDFDLSPLGYPAGQKDRAVPAIIPADEELVELVCRLDYIVRATMGTGDFFLVDAQRKKEILDTFGINSFDMESGAIADVCRNQGVPFVSIRKISDDADDSATSAYCDMAYSDDASLSLAMYDFIEKVL